jgi:hypothetical protein
VAMVGPCCSAWKRLVFFKTHFAKQVELFNSGSKRLLSCLQSVELCKDMFMSMTRTIFNNAKKVRFSDRPSKTSNRILRGANQSNEGCDACMDSCWYSFQCCEGHSKVDWKIDLGFKRRSTLQVK